MALTILKQVQIIEAFKSTSRYLNDLLNIDKPYFESMVNRIYPSELHLNDFDFVLPLAGLHFSTYLLC